MENTIHILRYGTNGDQKSIIEASKTFDYLAINANMVAHAGPSIVERRHFTNYSNESILEIRKALQECIIFILSSQMEEKKLNSNCSLICKKIIKERLQEERANDNMAVITLNWDTKLEQTLQTLCDEWNNHNEEKKYCQICALCSESSNGKAVELPQLESIIITPTYLKESDNLHLQNIWYDAYIDLTEADEIVFVGYSLPDADFELKNLLKRSIKSKQEDYGCSA